MYTFQTLTIYVIIPNEWTPFPSDSHDLTFPSINFRSQAITLFQSGLLFVISFGFPRIFAQFTSKIFTQSMESVSPQYRCLLKLLTKRFLMFCVKKPIILVELLLE